MKLAITILFLASKCLALAPQPDEHDLVTIHAPNPALTPSKAMLTAAVRLVTLPQPTSSQWLFQPSPVPPNTLLHLVWNGSSDANTAYYVVQSTTNLLCPWSTVTNSWLPKATIIGRQWAEFYRVLSVSSNNVNSVGCYEIPPKP